jgi:molybdenum cofactor biosynthesis protein B
LSTTYKHNKNNAPRKLTFYVFICSTSRYYKKNANLSDVSGNYLEDSLRKAGHKVIKKEIIADEESLIINALEESIKSPIIDAIIFSGGTGINSFDITIETISPFLEKSLPGFGEIFRHLSYKEIGSAAFLSRALAGIIDNKIIYCIPGSPNAAKIAIERLILMETGHIVKHIRE